MTTFFIIVSIVKIKEITRIIVSLNKEVKITKQGKSWRKVKPKNTLFLKNCRFMSLMQQAEGRRKVFSLIIHENNNKELCSRNNYGRFRGGKILIYNNKKKTDPHFNRIMHQKVKHIIPTKNTYIDLDVQERNIHQVLKN